jgi:hypothetical protein
MHKSVSTDNKLHWLYLFRIMMSLFMEGAMARGTDPNVFCLILSSSTSNCTRERDRQRVARNNKTLMSFEKS